MGNNYTHFTSDERFEIYQLLAAGKSQRKIAAILGRSPSSISREINRNSIQNELIYFPDTADSLSKKDVISF